MGVSGPLTSLALGRSPYDDVVQGEGPGDPRGHQQQYDERGRPINPETRRINRDVVRSHNEVMAVIGVAEPDNGIVEAQAEAARKHHQYEDRVGRRLLLTGGVLETAAIWGVNGMRQRILLYKPYSQTTFYGMFRLVWEHQSLTSYFFGGLPSFLASTVLEQLAIPGWRKYPVIRYATTYVRLHLAIYTFFQRTGIIPFNRLLPSWDFFIPGTSSSPIPFPPAPTSFRPRNIVQWLGAFALGAAPFAGFYLYTKLYSLITRTLRLEIYRLLPRPYNANRGGQFRDAAALPLSPDAIAAELQTDDPLQTLDPFSSGAPAGEPSPGAPLRRQSTVSLRGSGGVGGASQDDFASDDEETELISATLISFDVEATDPTPEPTTGANNNNANNNNNNGGTGATTPGVWSAELRPNLAEGGIPGSGPPGGGSGGGGVRPGYGASGGPEPVYRVNALTCLPAILATDVLAITPARLLMVPFAAAVWIGLARSYTARLGGVGSVLLDGVRVVQMQRAAGCWWGLSSGTALVNLLGLEMLLALAHGYAAAGIVLLAQRFRYSEEEWNEREGVAAAGQGEGSRI